MSPLMISMLMRLYSRAEPFEGMPSKEIHAPAMLDAFCLFRRHGLLGEDVTLASVKNLSVSYPFLSTKGHELVKRLCEVEP